MSEKKPKSLEEREEDGEDSSWGCETCLLGCKELRQVITLSEEVLFLKHGLQPLLLECPGLEHPVAFLL